MDPRLIHRILLAGPSNFESLRSSRGKFPSYQLYCEELFKESRSSQSPEYVIKLAYHDNVLAEVQKYQSVKPIWMMILELHKQIRLLIPNRSELHSMLNDEERELPKKMDVMAVKTILPWIQEAATALVRLESPIQATTTKEWIEQGNSHHQQYVASSRTIGLGSNNPEASFLISSIQYLIDKVSICQDEKTDFYLVKIVAPKFYSSGEGLVMERQYFSKRFSGHPSEKKTLSLPITQLWIKDLVSNYTGNKNQLQTNSRARQDLITKGWIEGILFNTKQQNVMILPEIFHLDVELMESIRSTTRIAAAGCALGLHACTVAKCNSDIMMKDSHNGKPLVQILSSNNRNRAIDITGGDVGVRVRHDAASSVEEYENSVQDAIVALAKSWKEETSSNNNSWWTSSNNNVNIDKKDIEILRGRTKSVLRGEDPVLKVLDDRMRSIFCELATIIDNNESDKNVAHAIPLQGMKTGRATTTKAQQPKTKTQPNDYDDYKDSPFVLQARNIYIERGLAFYAHDLAKATELSQKIAVLAYELYGEQFIDPMIFKAL